MTSPRTFALIPAAGKGQRMGRPKLLLPLGGRTIVERVVDAFRTAAIDTVLVVVGPAMEELAARAEDAGAAVLELAEQTAEMRDTIERGLDWLEEQRRPSEDDAWLLSPADQPALRPAIIASLLQARTAHPEHSIFLPVYQGRRGHPVLINWGHVAGIRRLPAGQGINAYLHGQAEQTFLLPAESADVLADLDTPEDYERWRQQPLT
jgi:molybdenum cofactor cytidylyltransferase